jgi:hypothetical protein
MRDWRQEEAGLEGDMGKLDLRDKHIHTYIHTYIHRKSKRISLLVDLSEGTRWEVGEEKRMIQSE